MQMTKLEALQKCLAHWQYMAKTGGSSKSDYFQAHNVPVEERPVCSCYCCAFDIQANVIGKPSGICATCPLNGYAWEDPSSFTEVLCHRSGSVYSLWMDSDSDEERKKHAAMLVYACERAISETSK